MKSPKGKLIKSVVCVSTLLVIVAIFYLYQTEVLKEISHVIKNEPQREKKKRTHDRKKVTLKEMMSSQRHLISRTQNSIKKFYQPPEDFSTLKEISDSEEQYVLSKRFVAVRKNVDADDLFFSQIGPYSIVEKNDVSLEQDNILPVAYN